MSEIHRPTEHEVVMHNAHTDPPHVGAIVHCLNHGGATAHNVVWTRDSIKSYDGWYVSPKVPADVKQIQMARFAVQPRGE